MVAVKIKMPIHSGSKINRRTGYRKLRSNQPGILDHLKLQGGGGGGGGGGKQLMIRLKTTKITVRISGQFFQL